MTMRGIMVLARHAVAVVRDQVDDRELGQTEEHKFVKVTEPVGPFDISYAELWWAGCCSGITVYAAR